ncbi:MAG: hypothetical protein HPY55_09270 [Firmicutes bacterium]|nr:hypothetical protein [Bacillota bacterium]
MKETLKAVESGFKAHGTGRYVQPPKTNLRKGPPGSPQASQGLIMAMPGYLSGEPEILGLKWVLAMTENPVKYGLPRSSSLIILNDPDTGLPIVIMEGTIINATRTGAATGVGAKYLARPRATVMGLVGAGPQGRAQVLGVAAAVSSLAEVRIFDLNAARAGALAGELMESTGLGVKVASSAREAARDADIVATATIAGEPYLEAEWLAPGAFYADVAANDATPGVYLRAGKVITDDWEQMKRHGAGTLLEMYRRGEVGDDRIYCDFGKIVAGEKPGRERDEETIVFKHIGMAVTELPEAYRIYRNAVSREIGTVLALWDKPIWV